MTTVVFARSSTRRRYFAGLVRSAQALREALQGLVDIDVAPRE